MARAGGSLCLALLGGALALGGCSSAALMEQAPAAMGGLPAGTPAAPAAAYRYPAVHDLPPPRADTPLTDEQQLKLEKQLQSARKKQEGEAESMQKNPLDADDGSKQSQ